MNLHDRAEFEKQLAKYAEVARLAHAAEMAPALCDPEVMRAKLHNARCDLVTWVSTYTAQQCIVAASQALEHSRRNSGPIADTSGGN